MYSAENYLWGLVAYYLGASLLLLFCWRFLRWVGWRPVRHLLLVIIAVLLLLPFNAYPDMDYLAPAWFVSIFEGLTNSTGEGYLRAGVPLIVGCLAGMLCYVVGAIIWFFGFGNKGPEKPASAKGASTKEVSVKEVSVKEVSVKEVEPDPLEESASLKENSADAETLR